MPPDLPAVPELTAITLAELHQGVAMAIDPAVRAARMEKLEAGVADFDPLPFDGDAAVR
jgi:toxin FitB